MRAIYYDGRLEGAAVAAKAEAAALRAMPDVGGVRLRDATAWAPAQGVEAFSGVSIPAGAEFDALASAYVDSGAEVARAAATTTEAKPAKGKAAPKEA